MIKKVYFDMDGVLVDFSQALTNFTGKEVEEILSWGKQLGMEDPIGYIMNQEVPNGLFAKAPAMAEFKDLKKIIHWLMENNIEVEILSSASEEKCAEEIIEQKKIWLKEKEILCPAHFVYGWQKKAAFAQDGVLLIDDFEKCIENFLAKGGQGILHKNANDTVLEFQKFFPHYTHLSEGDILLQKPDKRKIGF